MTNAINVHGTVQTRINGIGTALRCVMDVVRQHQTPLLRKRPGKRLHTAHRSYAASVSGSSSASPLVVRSGVRDAAWRQPPMPRTFDPQAARAATAEVELPAAVWATLVVARAASV